ncbi:hypothetical protein NC652_010197 [Populus alba x Populus x berolinensis]|nr:hypothetical protein NC652_010197 [Populus alba x Populus x berolinensis]
MFLRRKRDIGTVQSESNAPKSIEYYCLIEPCQYHVRSSSSRGTSSSKYRAHTYLEATRYCKLDGKNSLQISLQILLDFFFLFDYQYTSVALK